MFVCTVCGKQSMHKLGLCPDCQTAGSYKRQEVPDKKPKHVSTKRPAGVVDGKPRLISDVEEIAHKRYSTGMNEFDRVLGGGIVPGSLVLIGGAPGAGKSTMLLSTAASMSASGLTVLYVSGEESETQIKMRADRLGCKFGQFYLVFGTDVDKVVSEFIPDVKPDILIIDSINTMTSADVGAAASSPSQVNYAIGQLQRLAKSTGLSVFIVGQVTLEGNVAGGRKVSHDVDTVLYLEGDMHNWFRLLRAQKNRFGSVGEIGVFEMAANGLVEVGNPSAAFLAERASNKSGSSVAVLIEGSRPLIVEVQALCSTSSGNPARRSTGVSRDRMYIISAVLDKYIPVVDLFDTDLFMSVVGGMKVVEPAADLSMALAIVSSFQDIPTPNDIAAIGEIGLTGELRSVTQLELRLKEAANLGFTRVVVPKMRRAVNVPDGLKLIECTTLEEAIAAAFDGAIVWDTDSGSSTRERDQSRRHRRQSSERTIDIEADMDENGNYDTENLFR